MTLLDFIALVIFFGCWVGYTYFSKYKAKHTDCLARVLHQHRIHWMYQLLTRDLRVAEAALLANLERNIAFFASSTLLVLAGVLALYSQVDQLQEIIGSFRFSQVSSHAVIQIKLSLLVFIFVFAFFKFTWSMRQYGFLNVMIGATPVVKKIDSEQSRQCAKLLATVQDQAAHAYNYGLRAYYFSLAVLTWFFHSWLFIVASCVVVYTLYHREFHSRAVAAITESQQLLNEHFSDHLNS
jgi:uncharacterized membrane protein